MVKEALVVNRDALFKKKYFHGFLPAHEYDYTPDIKKNLHYYPRGQELEHNASVKQIIPYVWIMNPRTKKVFAYRRANNEQYSEVRLRNKWSCGVGGHIEKEDGDNPIHDAMMRELHEEVIMRNYPQPCIFGYVNYEYGVELYHFGIVALAETDEEEIAMGDGEIAEGLFMSIAEIEYLFAQPENQIEMWTLLSWPLVKQYLLSLT